MKLLLCKLQPKHCLYKLGENFYVSKCFLTKLASATNNFSLYLAIFRRLQLNNMQCSYLDLYPQVQLMLSNLGRFLRLCYQKMKEYSLCTEQCSWLFVCCHLCYLFIPRICSCMGRFHSNRVEKLLEVHQTLQGLIRHIEAQKYMHQYHLLLILNLRLIQLDFLKAG